MARWIALEPPGAGLPASAALDRAVLVRDGFSLLALALPVVWLLWHRLWSAALAAAALTALATLAAWHLEAPLVALAVDLAIALLVALEGPSLRVAALEAQGWRMAGILHAASAGEAEIRHIAAGASAAAVAAAAAPPPPVPSLQLSPQLASRQAVAPFPVLSPARG